MIARFARKTETLGRAKRKGVGGGGIFARPRFPAAEFRANEVGAPPLTSSNSILPHKLR